MSRITAIAPLSPRKRTLDGLTWGQWGIALCAPPVVVTRDALKEQAGFIRAFSETMESEDLGDERFYLAWWSNKVFWHAVQRVGWVGC